MKKLMIGVVVLLANVAMAVPGFDILGDEPIAVPDDGTAVEIVIATSGTGTIGGMELYLMVDPVAFEIVGLQGANVGGLFTQPGNTAADTVYLYPDIVPSPQYAVDFLSTTSDILNVPAGSIVAKAMVRAVPGTLVGTEGRITTDLSSVGLGASNFGKGEANGQDAASLLVVPEPVSALLLLAGLPLLRRRHA